MMDKILNLDSVDQYNSLYGLETLNPLVSVIDLNKATRQMDYVHWNYGVYALLPPGRRPPHPPRRQRQGLHGEDHDRPEPQEAEHRLRVRRRDRGLLPEHRHRGGRAVAPLSAVGQADRALLLDRVLQVLEMVRELHGHPHRLQDLRQTAEGRRRYARARRAADDGGVLRGVDEVEEREVPHPGAPGPQGRGREVDHADLPL